MGEKDRELLAKTLMAEAGIQSVEGMLAAGSVVINRARPEGIWKRIGTHVFGRADDQSGEMPPSARKAQKKEIEPWRPIKDAF